MFSDSYGLKITKVNKTVAIDDVRNINKVGILKIQENSMVMGLTRAKEEIRIIV